MTTEIANELDSSGGWIARERDELTKLDTSSLTAGERVDAIRELLRRRALMTAIQNEATLYAVTADVLVANLIDEGIARGEITEPTPKRRTNR